MSRFYKANEEITLRFYQMPKVLFTNPRYKGLSLGAKAVYSILRDRQDLSIKNNWFDEERNIFLVFDIDSLAELLDVTRKTAIKYKKELVEFGLIIDKRIGQGKANRLYVLKPELVDESIEKYKKCKNDTSESVKMTLQEVSKLHTNDTEFIDTEFIDTVSQLTDKTDLETEKETIIEQAQIELYKGDHRKLLENTIERLLKAKFIKVNDNILNNNQIREQLNKLSINIIDFAFNKFRQAIAEKEIKNRAKYFEVLLLSCIEEYYANNILD